MAIPRYIYMNNTVEVLILTVSLLLQLTRILGKDRNLPHSVGIEGAKGICMVVLFDII